MGSSLPAKYSRTGWCTGFTRAHAVRSSSRSYSDSPSRYPRTTCKEIEEVERGKSSVVEKRITSVKNSVADTSVFIAAVSAKEEEVRLEDEATSRCNRPDCYNRLVERDDAPGAKSFFNTLPQVKRR